MKTELLATLWIRWLDACRLPAWQIAELVGRDEASVRGILRACRGEPPAGPPRSIGGVIRCLPVEVGIRNQAGPKIRTLRGWGCSASEIARILAIAQLEVEDFLERIRPIRGETLSRPRDRVEQGAFEASHARRRYRARFNQPDGPEWDRSAVYRAELAEMVKASERAELPELVNVQASEPAPNLWESPSEGSPQQSRERSSAGLTRADAIEIGRCRAAGESVKSLAIRFKVAENTIRNIANGLTWGGAGKVEP